MMAARSGYGGPNSIGGGKECPSRTGLARVGGDVRLAGWRVSGLVAAVRLEMERRAIGPGRD